MGGDLVATLAAQGRSVRALVRSEAAAEVVRGKGATPTIVDIFDPDGLRDALWGIPLLFHVAGVNQTCPRDPRPMDRVNIDGARSIVAAAADAGVGRVVLTSSAAAIGERQGTIGVEHTVHSGEYLSPYARSKHLGELAAFETASATGVDLVAVNPSSVQGPGRSDGSARLLLAALRSSRPWLVDTVVSIVDIADCTAGHLAAAERGRAGERYLVSGSSVKVSDVVDVVSRASGSDLDPRWISEGVVRSFGRPAARLLSWLRPSSGVCPALIDTLLHGHRFDAGRSERELGVVYRPLAETIARTVEWFRSEGLVDRG